MQHPQPYTHRKHSVRDFMVKVPCNRWIIGLFSVFFIMKIPIFLGAIFSPIFFVGKVQFVLVTMFNAGKSSRFYISMFGDLFARVNILFIFNLIWANIFSRLVNIFVEYNSHYVHFQFLFMMYTTEIIFP